MKAGIENGKIYIETKDFDNFYMENMPMQRFITLGEAIRLRKEINMAINASQQENAVARDKRCLCPGGIGICGFGNSNTGVCNHPHR